MTRVDFAVAHQSCPWDRKSSGPRSTGLRWDSVGKDRVGTQYLGRNGFGRAVRIELLQYCEPERLPNAVEGEDRSAK